MDQLHKLAAEMTETKLKAEVIAECERKGLVVNYHKRDQLSPVTGWPDLEIVGWHGVLYRELKNMTNWLSPAQRRMGSMLTAAGTNWSVWRPIDWWNDTIKQELLRIL